MKLGPEAVVLLPSVKDKFTGEPVRDFQVNWAIFDSDEADSISSGQAFNRKWETRALLNIFEDSFEPNCST